MIKIGINGFGRIGRLAFRSIIERDDIEVVGINDLLDIDTLAYLLKYDSVHGRFKGTIDVQGNMLVVNGNKLRITSERNPENIRWDEIDVDYVIESTGLFTDKDKASLHIKGGAKKVAISAPSKDANMFVMGVNHTDMSSDDLVFSNASCTTNCLAPVVKLLDDKFGFKQGFMTTIHAVTASQATVDSYNSKATRGRGALNNIIPTSTGAAKATIKILPHLKGKLACTSIRVPVSDVSLIDISFSTEKDTSLEEILKTFKLSSKNELRGVLGYTEDPVVSQDFVSDPRTSIIDAKACKELNKNFFKVVSWYDNEFGYATKIVDLIMHSAKL